MGIDDIVDANDEDFGKPLTEADVLKALERIKPAHANEPAPIVLSPLEDAARKAGRHIFYPPDDPDMIPAWVEWVTGVLDRASPERE